MGSSVHARLRRGRLRMAEAPRTNIQDIDQLRTFIKMNKRKEDYFKGVVEKAMRKKRK